jgi:argininosuccinate lyase
MPFRDAYKKVGLDIEKGEYHPQTTVKHTHEGSIGNLCLDEIGSAMDVVIRDFHFEKVEAALGKLLLEK